MINVMWFVLGFIFGGLSVLSYIRTKQLESMEEAMNQFLEKMMRKGSGKNGD